MVAANHFLTSSMGLVARRRRLVTRLGKNSERNLAARVSHRFQRFVRSAFRQREVAREHQAGSDLTMNPHALPQYAGFTIASRFGFRLGKEGEGSEKPDGSRRGG